jgi:hypothetical protein
MAACRGHSRFLSGSAKDVDARHMAGHDEFNTAT